MDVLKKKHKFPSKNPNLTKDDHGWFGSGNKYLLEKYLRPTDKIIIEFGCWLGLSSRFLYEHSSENSIIICVDLWEDGGNSIQNGLKSNKNALKEIDNKNKSNKMKKEIEKMEYRLNHLYNIFITNMWDYKDRIIPLKMDGKSACEYLSKLKIKPDFIYLDMDHTYKSVIGDLSAIFNAFPNTLIVGDDIKYHKGVGQAVKEGIIGKKYRIEMNKNSYVLIPITEKYDFFSEKSGLYYQFDEVVLKYPKEKLSIIIPMRNTKNIEDLCLKYSLHFNKLKRPYKLYFMTYSEIKDNLTYQNIGKLLNIGFDLSCKENNKIFLFTNIKLIPDSEYYDSYPDNPILIEYLNPKYFLQTYHLGSLLFNKFDFIRCNGYPNNVFNQYGHDISLYSRLIENNIKISLPILEEPSRQNTNNYNWENVKSKLRYDKDNDWKENGLTSLNYKVKQSKKVNELCEIYYV